MAELYRALPPEAIQIALVLFLSFLLGLEREEHKASSPEYAFGGVRAFPLIGIVGYAAALVSGGRPTPIVLGMAAVAAFLLMSYARKLRTSDSAGVTTEISALATYLVGALVALGHYWVATSLTVASLFLLELKTALEGLSARLAPREVLTFTTFLLLTAVVLPALPDRSFGPFELNPFRTWLIVVAVSAVSYGSYVVQRVTAGRGGVLLAAVLGGAYSSTVTTLVLSRRAAREERPHLLSGCVLIASGMMYLRLAALIALFSPALLAELGLPFVALAAVACGAGWTWSRVPDARGGTLEREYMPRNPLELGAAALFALSFVAVVILAQVVLAHLGRQGLYWLAVLTGLTDVDPFTMGMTQAAGSSLPVSPAAAAVIFAASSNNIAKAIYAYVASDAKTGMMSLRLLVGLALLGLVPLALL